MSHYDEARKTANTSFDVRRSLGMAIQSKMRTTSAPGSARKDSQYYTPMKKPSEKFLKTRICLVQDQIDEFNQNIKNKTAFNQLKVIDQG